MEDFATQISDLRSKLQLSQEELATRLGVSFATVNRWESGKSKPQRAQREAVERLLGEAGGESDPSAPPDTSPTTRRRRGISHSKVLGTQSICSMLRVPRTLLWEIPRRRRVVGLVSGGALGSDSPPASPSRRSTASRWARWGLDFPLSQRLTVAKDTPSLVASSSWLSCSLLRRSLICVAKSSMREQ